MSEAVDPTRCPLCGDANACARAAGAGDPCWCAAASFPPELLARVPEAARGAACICARCARAAQPASKST